MNESTTDSYVEVLALLQRAHRQFLEVVKRELDKLAIHDITPVQGLLLFNIGDAEMTVGELTFHGCYHGANVSYNLRKMVEHNYMVQERSVHDRRVSHVRLTEKGREFRARLQGMYERHIEILAEFGVTEEDVRAMRVMLRRLEILWGRTADRMTQPHAAADLARLPHAASSTSGGTS